MLKEIERKILIFTEAYGVEKSRDSTWYPVC